MPSLFSRGIAEYIDGLVPDRPPELVAMERDAREHDFPIIGPACGQCCYVLTRLIGARRVFELGSGYGYSTAWFARGVIENGGGEVHHVVWDDDLSARARRHLGALDVDRVVQYHVGEAVAALGAQQGPFDVIFMDIDKAGYPGALPVIGARLRRGGVLIVDNMLWSGRVIDDDNRTPETEAIRRTATLLTRGHDWIATLVPLRDGLMVAMRA